MNSNHTCPKLYANVNQNKPQDYSNYEALEIDWGYLLIE